MVNAVMSNAALSSPPSRGRRSTETRPAVTMGAVALNGTALAVATALAISPLWPVYESPSFLIAVGVSMVFGIAVGAVGAVFRLSPLMTLVLSIGTYLLIGVPLGIPGQSIGGFLPTTGGLIELLSATALSWKQLLTIATPVGAYQALLVPVVVMVLATTIIGSTLALRTRRPELGAIPPLALFVAAILFGPTVAVTPIAMGLALGVVLVLWVTIQRGIAAGREPNARRSLAAAVVVAIAVGAGAATAIAYPAQASREVLRSHVQQPFDPRDYPSPLSAFRGWLKPAAASSPMFSVEGMPAGALVRLAALDTYDGVVYSVGSRVESSASGSFTRVPYRLDQSATPGRDVTISVSIEGYSGVWVPGAGNLESIRFGPDSAALADDFFYNDNAATGAVLGGLHAGDRYEATAVVPRAAKDVTALRPGTAVLPPIGTEPEGLSDALRAWARPTDPPGVQLAAVIAGIKHDGYVSHGISATERPSRSGHSADRITELFTDQPMLGDGEQYATTAALLARMIGFPARVVLGFVPRLGSLDGPVDVTGSDIAAWIEVQDAAGAWVAIDPNPAVRPIPPEEPDRPAVVSRPQVVVPPPPEQTSPEPDPARPQRADEQPAPDTALATFLAVLRIVGSSIAALAIILSPFLAVIAAKARRRRLRRRAPGSLERIEGGWREFTDDAVDRGFDLPRYATRSEIADLIGSARSTRLAMTVDRAVFAPEPPNAGEVDGVWADVAALQRSMDASLSPGRRLAAQLSLRSFRRYSDPRRERS